MEQEQFTIEILGDGTLKTTTDEVSAANHDSAESFLRNIRKLAGGPTHVERRTDREHTHDHVHQHEHVHQK